MSYVSEDTKAAVLRHWKGKGSAPIRVIIAVQVDIDFDLGGSLDEIEETLDRAREWGSAEIVAIRQLRRSKAKP